MQLPPNQQLVAQDKWPIVGERLPASELRPWSVEVAGGVRRPRSFPLEELRALPQATRAIDIHCVTRWSKPGMEFSGVPLAVLLEVCQPTAEARFVSFVARSLRRHSTSLVLSDALELDVLLALAAGGAPLTVDHGGPVRIITPQRYFYKSLKWLDRIELLVDDRLGYWEAEAGYHNHADPWREERYLAPTLTRHAMRQVLASRDFAGRDLRSIDARGHNLDGLNAAAALLRDADFRGCSLRRACFDGANLSNARLQGANLRGATLRGADVEGADFAAADLRESNFTGASLFGASFCTESPAADDPLRDAARIDGTTIIPRSALDALTPRQQVFLLEQLARIDSSARE